MKIRIRTEGHSINLAFPTRLLVGKTAVRLANRIGRRYAAEAMEKIPPEALEAICAELRRIKKIYGTWDLVDMRSADGDEIRIIL